MVKIIRHEDLYQDPVGFLQTVFRDQSIKTRRRQVFLFPTQTVLEYWEEQFLLAFGSWGGARFLLFDGLVRSILEETRPQLLDLSAGQGGLLLGLLAGELGAGGKLPYLNNAVYSTHLYASLREEILQLKRAGIGARDFTTLATGGSGALQELAILYEHYQQFMEEHQMADAEEKIRLAMIDAPQSTWLRELDQLMVFGFTDFTRQQTELLQTISNFLPVTLVFDHSMAGRQGLMPPKFTGEGAPEEKIQAALREGPDCSLTVLQNTLWQINTEPVSFEPDASIRLCKAKGGWRREVAYLAEEIKRLLKADPNLTPEQIGLVTTYPLNEVYQILTDSGLPVTAKLRTPLSTEPVAQALLQPFKVVLTEFAWTEMINYLRFGGITIRRAFFSFVPPATLAGWQGQLRASFAQYPETANRICILLELLARIPVEGTIEEYLCFCEQWLNCPLLQENILPGGVTAEPYRQARYRQTAIISKLNRLISEARTSLCRLAQKKLTVQQFYIMLTALLETEQVQLPTSWENGIRLLTPAEVRGVTFKVTVFAGLNEGFFPAIGPEGWLLRGEALKHSPLAAALPNNLEKLAMERLLFFYLIKSAEEQLLLSYCETDQEGEPLNPSSFLEDILAIYPGLTHCTTVAEADESVIKLKPNSTELQNEISDKIAAERNHRLGKNVESSESRGKRLAILKAKFTAQPLSVSALEEYAACPFSFFCRRILKLESMEEPEFLPTRLEEGERYHTILRLFFGRHRGEVLSRRLLPRYLEEIRTLVTEHYSTGDESLPLLYRHFLMLARENFYFSLEKVIKEEVAWAEETAGRFTAKFLELGFGGFKRDADPASTAEPLVLTAGREQQETLSLRLWGKIDRIDTDCEGRFIVYDYKSGNPPSPKAIKEGKLLQLPLYLLAVGRLFFPTAEPVGAAYYSLKQANRRRGIWRKESLNFGVSIRGALEEPDWDSLIEHSVGQALAYFQGILKGDFSFAPPEDCTSYCEFRTICRRAWWGREDENETE